MVEYPQMLEEKFFNVIFRKTHVLEHLEMRWREQIFQFSLVYQNKVKWRFYKKQINIELNLIKKDALVSKKNFKWLLW